MQGSGGLRCLLLLPALVDVGVCCDGASQQTPCQDQARPSTEPRVDLGLRRSSYEADLSLQSALPSCAGMGKDVTRDGGSPASRESSAAKVPLQI
jgi:hypothetical protein